MVDKTATYAAQPLLAAARPELGPLIRSFFMHRYVLIYRSVANGVEVIRVIHGSRDVFRVFRQQEP